MKFWRSLISINKPESSRSFTLVVSAFVAFLLGVAVAFVLIWDVITNGYIKTNLEDLGIFMVSIGGFLAGGSVSKVFAGKKSTYVMDKSGDVETDDSNGDTKP